MSIKVERVTKIYGEQKALNDVSFTIPSGQIVGFLGPNGAGKSTMMKIITGYIPQTSGLVEVNGINVGNPSRDFRKFIGYLPENNPLYPDMYVKEYLQFVASVYKIDEPSKRISKVVDITGIGVEQGKKIGALSKGYRQRVGLAQALIHNPNVLILDEPTSGLDPNQIIEIRNLISDIGKEKTVMLSTHIMQEVEAICQRILIINRGNLVADGLTQEILSNSFSSKKCIQVEFAQEINIENLQSLKGVAEIKKIDNKNWLIFSNSDIREHIFNFAVNNNIVILSLFIKEPQLEEVFQQLTIS